MIKLKDYQKYIKKKFYKLPWHEAENIIYLTHTKSVWGSGSYIGVFYDNSIHYYENGDAKSIEIKESEILKYYKLETRMRNFI